MIIKAAQYSKQRKADDLQTKNKLGLSYKVFSGSLWNLGSQGIIILTSLLATPFTIRLLGIEAYGVFSLINLLIGYLAVSDLGMGQAAIRFGAAAHSKRVPHNEATVIWTSLLVLLIPVGIASFCLIIVAPNLVSEGLKLSAHLHQETVLALRVAALGLLAKSVANVLIASQYIRMRADLYSLISTLSSVGQIILIPVFLFLGGGLLIAIVIIAGVNIAISLINGILLRQLLPEWGKPEITLQLIRPLLQFGGATSLMTLMGIALLHIEKLVLVHLESVVVLAHYSVAFNLARMLTIFPAVLGQPLLSAFSKLQADEAWTALQRLYNQAVRGLLLGLIPVSLVICASAQPVLGLWAGEEFAQRSLYPLYILVIGAVFDGVSYVPRILLSAIGRPGLIARFQVINLIPYFFLVWILIGWGGTGGAAIAWTIRSAVECFMVFYTVRQQIGFICKASITEGGKYLITLVALLGVSIYFSSASASVMTVISLTMAAFLIHVAMVWRWILTKHEKRWMGEMLCANLQITQGNRFYKQIVRM